MSDIQFSQPTDYSIVGRYLLASRLKALAYRVDAKAILVLQFPIELHHIPVDRALDWTAPATYEITLNSQSATNQDVTVYNVIIWENVWNDMPTPWLYRASLTGSPLPNRTLGLPHRHCYIFLFECKPDCQSVSYSSSSHALWCNWKIEMLYDDDADDGWGG